MDALTCALAALLLAGAPGHQLPIAVQDDALLLNRSPAPVQQYLCQMRGTHGPQLVHVERRDPGTSARVPVSVTGQGCDQGTEFSTESAGAFMRLAPYNGNAPYRMTVRQPEGNWVPSVEVPVT